MNHIEDKNIFEAQIHVLNFLLTLFPNFMLGLFFHFLIQPGKAHDWYGLWIKCGQCILK